MPENIEKEGESLWKKLWGHEGPLFVLEDVVEHPELPSMRRQAWLSRTIPETCPSIFLDSSKPPEAILFRDEYAEATHWMERHLASQTSSESTLQYPQNNPFLGDLGQSNPRDIRGCLFHGHPGIGKTVFANIILFWRLQARLPTAFLISEDIYFYFDQHGSKLVELKQISEKLSIEHNIDRARTWFMIDARLSLHQFPDYLYSQSIFIIHFSSTRPSNFQWVKKLNQRVKTFIFKPNTAEEAVICARLERNANIDQETIQAKLEYFSSYSPSIHNALKMPAIQDDFALKQAIDNLSYAEIESFFSRPNIIGSDVHEEISHQILTVEPDVTNRENATLVISSKRIFNLLEDRLRTDKSFTLARWFDIFMTSTGSRASAGYVLDKHLHRILQHRRSWTLHPMSISNKGLVNEHWTTTSSSKSATGTRLDLIVPQHAIEFEDIGDLVSKLTSTSTTSRTYYKLMKLNEATLDAVVFQPSYDKSKCYINIIQATVGRQHGVKKEAAEKLHNLGMVLRYVAVVPPEQAVDFHVEKGVAKLFKKAVYYLEVSSKDIQHCGW
ncbi:hypothetical protein EDD85DRAFT_983750 [Armillaria nabsnona]|nr:hypothetical protein EDD85DRAFT_983750 [Armillaria nabsnona]